MEFYFVPLNFFEFFLEKLRKRNKKKERKKKERKRRRNTTIRTLKTLLFHSYNTLQINTTFQLNKSIKSFFIKRKQKENNNIFIQKILIKYQNKETQN